MKTKQHVHFMGIGGSGLAGVALIAQAQGFQVSGCDLKKETFYLKSLKKIGLKPQVGHNINHLQGIDILAVSPAVLDTSPHHPEVAAARKEGILMTWQQFMGKYLQKDKYVIAVAGTHGKSTTTALLGLVLEAAGLDPTVEVGAIIPEWQASARPGQSQYFVCEADEFNNNFLNYSPSLVIINNIEMDHPEFFQNFDQFQQAFVQFVHRLTGPKILIVNQESKGVQRLLKSQKGWLTKNKVKIIDCQASQARPKFQLKIPGEHNLANAWGVWLAAEQLGIKPNITQKVFKKFNGLGRRFDLVGETKRVKVFDDYAVHPTAVKATLKTARQKYSSAKIWAIFEPHQYSRLYLFLNEFAQALELADKIMITKIFPGREKDTGKIKAQDLVAKIGAKVQFEPDFDRLADQITRQAQAGDIIIVFGAGQSYLISQKILAKLKKA